MNDKTGILNNTGKYMFAVFFLFSALTYLMLHKLPLSVDDFGFQQLSFHTNGDALHYVLNYGNGRLFGNGGILFLIHRPVLGDVLRAALLSGIAVLLPAVLKLQKKIMPVLSMFLVLTISPAIFGQAYSWMSGFQNYIPPIFLFLAGLLCVQKAGSSYSAGSRIVFLFLCFLCGTGMQLYIEHSTCINLCISAIILLTVLRKEKWRSYRVASGMLFAGAVLGCAVMVAVTVVSNPQIQDGTIGHTSYLSSGIQGLLYGVARNCVLVLGMFSENAVLLFLLSALLITQITINRTAFSDRERILYPICMLIPAVVFILQLIAGLHPWYGKLAVFESALIVISWLVYILSGLAYGKKIWACGETDERLALAGAMLCFSVIGVLPLLVIWPIGYRCLIHSSVSLIGAVLLLTDKLLDDIKQEKAKLFNTAIASVLAAVFICEIMIFSDIRRMVSIRDTYLEQQAQAGAEKAAYFTIPSPYIYDPWDQEMEHSISINGQEIQLEILPADVWFRMIYYHYT